MYDGTYDEYIRSILGYNQNELYDYGYNDNYNNYRMQDNISIAHNSQLEQSYPEIYKVVYPMVSKRCENAFAPYARINSSGSFLSPKLSTFTSTLSCEKMFMAFCEAILPALSES